MYVAFSLVATLYTPTFPHQLAHDICILLCYFSSHLVSSLCPGYSFPFVPYSYRQSSLDPYCLVPEVIVISEFYLVHLQYKILSSQTNNQEFYGLPESSLSTNFLRKNSEFLIFCLGSLTYLHCCHRLPFTSSIFQYAYRDPKLEHLNQSCLKSDRDAADIYAVFDCIR